MFTQCPPGLLCGFPGNKSLPLTSVPVLLYILQEVTETHFN